VVGPQMILKCRLTMHRIVSEINDRSSTKDAMNLDMCRLEKGTSTRHGLYRMFGKQNLCAMPQSVYACRIPDFM
jgi:hypothetical protein